MPSLGADMSCRHAPGLAQEGRRPGEARRHYRRRRNRQGGHRDRDLRRRRSKGSSSSRGRSAGRDRAGDHPRGARRGSRTSAAAFRPPLSRRRSPPRIRCSGRASSAAGRRASRRSPGSWPRTWASISNGAGHRAGRRDHARGHRAGGGRCARKPPSPSPALARPAAAMRQTIAAAMAAPSVRSRTTT